MKLLQPDEIKTAKERELARDILRTQTVKETLDDVKKELNEANAKFEVALSNQRVRWLTEEEKYTDKMETLRREVDELERKKKALLIPIDDERNKAHDLMKSAEQIMEAATKRQVENEAKSSHLDELTSHVEARLDAVSDKEQSLEDREQKLIVREAANQEERENIKRLSQELLVKLSKL